MIIVYCWLIRFMFYDKLSDLRIINLFYASCLVYSIYFYLFRTSDWWKKKYYFSMMDRYQSCSTSEQILILKEEADWQLVYSNYKILIELSKVSLTQQWYDVGIFMIYKISSRLWDNFKFVRKFNCTYISWPHAIHSSFLKYFFLFSSFHFSLLS